MKKYLLLTAAIIFSLSISAQQKEKYYRLQISLEKTTMQQLLAMGIAVDHGDIVKGKWIESDFSQQELNMLQQKNISYKILIEDVSQYYAVRNKN
ncbi:MAG TPA: hypothetical protein PL045_13625, partial [Chitinophagaceae bacterium]|nr:hypothetical protein [Chitinophagaceae bacterium]